MSSPRNRKKKSLGHIRLASIGALTITLCILGIIGLFRLLAIGLERDIKEQISFDIELPEGYNAESYQLLKPELRAISGISEESFISTDSAFSIVKAQVGEDPSELIGYNPMRALVRLKVSASHLEVDSMRKIQQELSSLGLDASSLNPQDQQQLDTMNRNFRIVEWLLWIFVGIQVIFTFILINNTTRISIYAERLQIRTLTLVGASSWFIRRPIIFRSLVDGFIATLISISIFALTLYTVEVGLGWSILTLVAPLHLAILAAALLLIALTASFIASTRAASRYIKMDGSRIHLI